MSKLPTHLRHDQKGWYLDYRAWRNGRIVRVRKRLECENAEEARKLHAEHLPDMLNKRLIYREQAQFTLKQAIEAFMDYSRHRRRSWKRDELSTRHLFSVLGDIPLASLNLDLVEKYLRTRKEAINKPADATLNRELACLKTIVNRAMRNGWIEKNPIYGAKLFKEHSRDRTLTPEEYQALLNACSDHIRPIVELAYMTGMRRGEILGLKLDQVDLKARVLTLRPEETKTSEKREIPLPEGLVHRLERLPRAFKCPYLFTYEGKRIKDIKTAFNAACRRAGIRDFRFHDLRHCAITNLRKAGVDQVTIMSISGHKSANVFRRYNHVDREDRGRAIEKLGHFLDTLSPLKTKSA